MIIEDIRKRIKPGQVILKPEAKADFKVKAWGKRRSESALIYTIPNHKNPAKPYEKGITESEFIKAFEQLNNTGEFSRSWFNTHLEDCAKEGGCNFTTIGGIFELLEKAKYTSKGIYKKV